MGLDRRGRYGRQMPSYHSFCVYVQSFVTCLFAGTPMQLKRRALSYAGSHGTACWSISS